LSFEKKYGNCFQFHKKVKPETGKNLFFVSSLTYSWWYVMDTTKVGLGELIFSMLVLVGAIKKV
jgi:hypothetical protein